MKVKRLKAPAGLEHLVDYETPGKLRAAKRRAQRAALQQAMYGKLVAVIGNCREHSDKTVHPDDIYTYNVE